MRREVFEVFRAASIRINLHYIPLYRQPYYEQWGYKPGYCPEAECYYAEPINFPMYPGLAGAEQNHVIESLKSALLPSNLTIYEAHLCMCTQS
jgi:dTDP-4-amino-4,6-dideoxygalactose transaminase